MPSAAIAIEVVRECVRPWAWKTPRSCRIPRWRRPPGTSGPAPPMPASMAVPRRASAFNLLPNANAAPGDPPAVASSSSSPFILLFPGTADRAIPLLLDLYKILRVEPHFLGDGIRMAFEARIAKPPQYGYSTNALVGRRQKLQIAHDTLTNQSSCTEYDRALSEDHDAALTMDVAWGKIPGVLCVLQEAGI